MRHKKDSGNPEFPLFLLLIIKTQTFFTDNNLLFVIKVTFRVMAKEMRAQHFKCTERLEPRADVRLLREIVRAIFWRVKGTDEDYWKYFN